jgi:hypothetical protein
MSRISSKNISLLEKEKDKDDSILSLSLEQLFENEDLIKSMSQSSNYHKFSH